MAVSRPVSAVLVVVASRSRPGGRLGGGGGGGGRRGRRGAAPFGGCRRGVVGFAGAAVGAAAGPQPARVASKTGEQDDQQALHAVPLR